MFFRPWPAAISASSKPEPSSTTLTKRSPARSSIRTSARRAPACLREFLDDAKHLDLLVGGEPDPILDLEVDLELAIGREEVDVTAESRVEGCRAACRRERQHGETRLLLGRGGRFLELRERRLGRSAVLEHGRVSRDRKQVLRQAVVDLSRDACALLGHGPAEFGEADRAPDADQQHAVGEQPQEVALRDVAVREQRREDVVQLGEERQSCAEAEPAVEVVPAGAETQAPADHGHKREQRLDRQRARELERLLRAHVPGDGRQRGTRLLRDAPREPEHDRDGDQHLAERSSARIDPPPRERRSRDQDSREQAAAEPGPELGPVEGVPAEHRRDRERERRRRRGREAAAQEQVEPPPVHRETKPGQQRDDCRSERHRRVEDEPDLRQRVRAAQGRIGDEQRERSPQQPDQEHLAPEPGLVVVTFFVPH